MFSLIITIVAIALVALLALATIFYGTTFLSEGSARAMVTRTLQEGNQVIGAVELYKADHDGKLPTGTSDEIKATLLSTDYLKAWPDVNWEFRTDYAVRTGLSEDSCLSINKSLGIDTVPQCSDTNYTNRSFCCSAN